MIISNTEENYLKAIYKLAKIRPSGISTKSISELLKIKSPTVSDMLKKLSDKKLINYEKYKGVELTPKGEQLALLVIRKHRLWETFLVEKLEFKWDEVHEIAEQLEHIQSAELVDRLDKFLDRPRFDPHGDPIPNEQGKIELRYDKTLNQLKLKENAVVVGVKDHSKEFLKYLDGNKIQLGSKLKVMEIIDYDNSMQVQFDAKNSLHLSAQVIKNIIVK
ncbi:MAG: metal-dependent transcriptional regulator [Crocinitomicaceae bacterium]